MQHCPQCGADLDRGSPQGLCAACLFAGGVGVPEELETKLTTAGAGLAPDDPRAALEYDSFGPYRILRVLGEGGMGTVYLAEQTRPIQRNVALKVVKPGMDTGEVLSRFAYERQTLALMDHPNIAHVYDAGATEKGRPYFVMEYIDGAPITQYCDAHRLNTRERLELFGLVCQAIQHAHSKGVIHRDIKPSNVLVIEQDGRAVPKVIDFGIAKATDRRAVENAASTRLGQFIGTPEYMSPEQADLVSNDVDTSSDVYSLGVVLYELLVGAVPFDAAALRRAGLAELLRVIREEEAPALTAKLTGLGKTATQVAEQRHTDPGSLKRQVAGDLNWIVMKALEKDRQRRYHSAAELAADVKRHLEDEPVLASPPSAVYRTRKFVRRHKAPVLAGVLIATSLVAGVIAVGWEARVAESRRAEAEQQRARADLQAAQALLERNRAEENARVANAQRIEAEALFSGVRDLTNSMLFDVTSQIAELQGATAAREILVRKGVAYLDRLSKNARATPEVRRDLAEAYLKIGDLQFRRVHPSLGDPTAAFDSYARSVALLEPLVRLNPRDPKLMHLLIQAYKFRGWVNPNEAAGKADCMRALAMAEARSAAEPKNMEALHDLASALAAAPIVTEANSERARILFAQLIENGVKDPEVRRELAWQYQNLGNLEAGTNPTRALEFYATSLEQFAGLAREYPWNAVYLHEHATALLCFVGPLENLKRTKEAIEYNRQAVTMMQKVVLGDARNVSFRRDLIEEQMELARLLYSDGNRQEAIAHAREALTESDRMVSEDPANPYSRFQRSVLNIDVSNFFFATGDPKTGLEYFRKAESELAVLARQYPANTVYGISLGISLGNLQLEVGNRMGESGDGAGALARYRQALAQYERVAAGKKRGDPVWTNAAAAHVLIASGLHKKGDHKGEREEEMKAVAIDTQVVAAHPESAGSRGKLSETYAAVAYGNLGDQNWDTVIEYAKKALPYREERFSAEPASLDRAEELAAPLRALGDAYGNKGDAQAEIEIRRRLVGLRERSESLAPNDLYRAQMRVVATAKLASVLASAGDGQASQETTRQVIGLLEQKVVPLMEERVRQDPGSADKRTSLAATYRQLAEQQRSVSDPAGASNSLQKAQNLEAAKPK